MRIYTENQELTEVVCNMCGKKLKTEHGMIKEGCVSIEQQFGYFSGKDGILEKFDLCEKCYQHITDQFVVPAESEEMKELL